MVILSRHLHRCGFTVFNFGYPSREGSIDEHVEALRAFIDAAAPSGEPLSFVGHSLGGIIVRAFALRYQSELTLHRLVMLGPPNQGSELARILKTRVPVVKRLMGASFVEVGALNLAPASDILHIGIIAGTALRSHPLFSGVNDGIVSVGETELEGAADAAAVWGLHSFLMFQPRVLRLAAAFLERGRFETDEA